MIIDYNKILNYLPNFSIIGDEVELVLHSSHNLKNVSYNVYNPNIIRKLNYDGLVDTHNKIHIKEVIGEDLKLTLSSAFLFYEDIITLNDNNVIRIDINDDDLIKSKVTFIYNTTEFFNYKLINTEHNIEYDLDNNITELDILYGTYRLEIGKNNYAYTFKKTDYVNIYDEELILKLPVIEV